MIRKLIRILCIIIAVLLALLFIFIWPYLLIVPAVFIVIWPARSKGLYQNIVLSLITFLVCLALAEAYCRIDKKYATYSEKTATGGYMSPFRAYDRSWYYVFTPYSKVGTKETEFSMSWTTNNEGFRDVDFLMPKDKIRVMAIGDSFTQGVGADNDSTLPKQLGYILRDSFHTKTEVWNCGRAGSDLVYEFRLFNDKLLKYRPDMLLVLVNSSDINDVVTKGGFERFLPDSTVRYRSGPWFEPAFGQSFLVRQLVFDVFKYNWQLLPPGQVAKANADAIHILGTAMDSFSRVCAARNIKLLFVFHPTYGEFDNGVPYESTPLIGYCREKRLPCIDVREELYKMGYGPAQAKEIYWPLDGHFNNKGYRCFAESIWRRVAGILDK